MAPAAGAAPSKKPSRDGRIFDVDATRGRISTTGLFTACEVVGQYSAQHDGCQTFDSSMRRSLKCALPDLNSFLGENMYADFDTDVFATLQQHRSDAESAMTSFRLLCRWWVKHSISTTTGARERIIIRSSVLEAVMKSPFERFNFWTLLAVKCGDNVFVDHVPADRTKEVLEEEHKKFMHSGMKFLETLTNGCVDGAMKVVVQANMPNMPHPLVIISDVDSTDFTSDATRFKMKCTKSGGKASKASGLLPVNPNKALEIYLQTTTTFSRACVVGFREDSGDISNIVVCTPNQLEEKQVATQAAKIKAFGSEFFPWLVQQLVPDQVTSFQLDVDKSISTEVAAPTEAVKMLKIMQEEGVIKDFVMPKVPASKPAAAVDLQPGQTAPAGKTMPPVMVLQTNSTRASSYLDKLKSKEAEVQNPTDAERLFRQLLKQKDAPEKLVLTCDDKLQPALSDAVMILHPAIDPVLEFLDALGAEKLSHGVYRSHMLMCYRTVYTARGFMDNILERLRQKRLRNPAAIAWFLLKLAHDRDVREDSTVLATVALLQEEKAAGAHQLATMFASVGAPAEAGQAASEDDIVSLSAAKAAMRPPGCRDHDNDKTNFRDITIVPTPSELDCMEQPYLPPCEGSEFITNPEAAMLDRHFRLLREDLVGPIREELKEQLKRSTSSSATRGLYTNPVIVGVEFKPEPHFVLRLEMSPQLAGRIRKMNRRQAEDFFESGPGRKVLGQDTLVVLFNKIGIETESIKTVAVGAVVARRDILSKDHTVGNKLYVGVSFMGGSLTSIMPALRTKSEASLAPLATHILNSMAGFFNYKPILETLQGMDDIPLGDVLLHLEAAAPPQLAHGGKNLDELSAELQEAVESDASQKSSLQIALDSKVVLVHGPPGTGKTYTGVQMVKAMLEAEATLDTRQVPWGSLGMPPETKELRILCLCYTNHALDSFLESLLDAGIAPAKFIRLGSTQKVSDRLKSRCLREVEDSKFGPSENRAFAILKGQQHVLEEKIRELEEDLDQSQWGRSVQSWTKIQDFLEDENYDEYLQLRSKTYDEAGFQIVGADGGNIKSNYLWLRWCSGLNRGYFEDGQQHNIWDLSVRERQEVRETWYCDWVKPIEDQLASLMDDLRKNSSNFTKLKQHASTRVLRKATIIGCTVVSAAKQHTLMQEVAPTVVLVEEAGEILEAQVLTNITSECQQLIMIGDHKQLRPKVEHFQLRKEAGRGFNIDISLFERMVLSRTEQQEQMYEMLQVQHRMRPEFSRLIRETTYPSLQDHSSVLDRPSVLGVPANLLFVNHQHEEITSAR